MELIWDNPRFTPAPTCREGGTMVRINNNTYLFGGRSLYIFDDVYKLDCKSFKWKLKKSKGPHKPLARYGHSANNYED